MNINKVYPVDTRLRSLAKALTWRLAGFVFMWCLAWGVTRNISSATAIGLLDLTVKIGLYYLHERFWERVDFGKAKALDYEI